MRPADAPAFAPQATPDLCPEYRPDQPARYGPTPAAAADQLKAAAKAFAATHQLDPDDTRWALARLLSVAFPGWGKGTEADGRDEPAFRGCYPVVRRGLFGGDTLPPLPDHPEDEYEVVSDRLDAALLPVAAEIGVDMDTARDLLDVFQRVAFPAAVTGTAEDQGRVRAAVRTAAPEAAPSGWLPQAARTAAPDRPACRTHHRGDDR